MKKQDFNIDGRELNKTKRKIKHKSAKRSSMPKLRLHIQIPPESVTYLMEQTSFLI